MAKIAEVFGINLKNLRKRKGLSAKDFAAAIGVSPVTISRWETGDMLPGWDNVSMLAKGLNVEETELFRDPNYQPPEPTIREALAVIARAGGLDPTKPLDDQVKGKK